MAAIRQIQIQLHTLTRRQHNSINNDWHTSNTHLISPGSVQCSYTERYKRSVCIRSPKGQTYSSVLFTWERHLCLNHSFSSVAVSKESGLSLLWWEKKNVLATYQWTSFQLMKGLLQNPNKFLCFSFSIMVWSSVLHEICQISMFAGFRWGFFGLISPNRENGHLFWVTYTISWGDADSVFW